MIWSVNSISIKYLYEKKKHVLWSLVHTSVDTLTLVTETQSLSSRDTRLEANSDLWDKKPELFVVGSTGGPREEMLTRPGKLEKISQRRCLTMITIFTITLIFTTILTLTPILILTLTPILTVTRAYIC